MNYSDYRKRDFSSPRSAVLVPSQVLPRRPMSWTISYRLVAPIAMCCDILIIVSVGMLSCAAYHLMTIGSVGDVQRYGGLAAVVAALFVTLARSRGLYAASELLNFRSQVRKIAVKWLGILLFLATVAFAMKIGEQFSRAVTSSFGALGLAALIATRAAWRMILADGMAVRKFAGRKIALIAEQSSAVESGLLEALSRHGMQLTHHFVLPHEAGDYRRIREIIAQAVAAIRRSDVEEVVIATDPIRWPRLSDEIKNLHVLPLPVNLVPVGPTSDLFHLPSHKIGNTISIELQRGPRTLFERAIKRAVDIVLASFAILLLLPLFLMTALAIKMDSRGPTIFRQRRCGFNGRIFYIMKFRTMSVLEDGEVIAHADPRDSRVTRVGRWLRRTSIDELPQLFNVITGNMSIVGPRPHALAHDDQFEKLVGDYAYRHQVKPGITGWAQAKGYRGSVRTVDELEERIRLDLWYIDNWSLTLDFRIMLLTVVEILRGKNAY